MSGGSRGQTTTTQAVSGPWGPAQPFLQRNLSNAESFYQSPSANQTFQGTTVIPFSSQSVQGMNQMEGVARQAMKPMQNAMTAYSGMMDSVQPLARGDFSGTPYEGSQGIQSVLDPIARGDFTNDTTFVNNLGRAQQDAAQSVNLAMSGAGRYGSGQHVDRLASAVGDLTNRAMLDRQQMALGQYGAVTDRLGGAQNQAAGQLLSFGNAMPDAYAAALAPGQTLRSIGQQHENLAANYAQEQLDRFNAPTELARRNLMEQNALYSGVGGLGGQQSGLSTVRTPGMSGTQMAGMGLSTVGRLAGGSGKGG